LTKKARIQTRTTTTVPSSTSAATIEDSTAEGARSTETSHGISSSSNNTDAPTHDDDDGDDDGSISGRKRKFNWRCDVCLAAVFEDYDDAVAHEAKCTGSRNTESKETEFERNKKKAKSSSAAAAGGSDIENGADCDVAENHPDPAAMAVNNSKTDQDPDEWKKDGPPLPQSEECHNETNNLPANRSIIAAPLLLDKAVSMSVHGNEEMVQEVATPGETNEDTTTKITDVGAATTENNAAPEVARYAKVKTGGTAEERGQEIETIKLRDRSESIIVVDEKDEGDAPSSSLPVVVAEGDVASRKKMPRLAVLSTAAALLLVSVCWLVQSPDDVVANFAFRWEGILPAFLLPTTTSITFTIAINVIAVVVFSSSILLFVRYATATTEEEEGEAAALTTRTLPLTSSATCTAPTLREYLSHPDGFHMAFAPAFFGFFAYFGALAALEEETGLIVPTVPIRSSCSNLTDDDDDEEEETASACNLKSTSGASAGAMAAVMLAAGIKPRVAADFASTFTWSQISDPPALLAYAKGHNFERAMRSFIMEHAAAPVKLRRKRGRAMAPVDGDGEEERGDDALQLEETLVPVAVSGFDVLRMREKILRRGCMAKAARASAGFPGLFQPVPWREEEAQIEVVENEENGSNEDWWWRRWWTRISTKKPFFSKEYSLLIDGGITDGLGLNGLPGGSSDESDRANASFASSFSSSSSSVTTIADKKEGKMHIINMMVGESFGGIHGDTLPKGAQHATSLVSIALVGTPMCGPWAMQNGPRAVESTRRAMVSLLDVPMERVVTRGRRATMISNSDDDADNTCQHYVLRVDASKWLEK